jgi:hypothetical protein
MRTKTLLLATAIGAVGIATSMAQVFSQNAVGYYNKDLPQGFSLLANQFNNGANDISTVIPTALDGTIVLTWNESTQQFTDGDVYFDPDGWFDIGSGDPSATVLAPGGSFFVNSPAATTLTFVGEVPEGDNLTVTMPPGFSFKSQPTPQELALDSAGDAIPPNDGDIILFWLGSSYNDGFVYFEGDGAWFDIGSGDPVSPTPEVGQGFVYNNAGADVNWTRSFHVN